MGLLALFGFDIPESRRERSERWIVFTIASDGSYSPVAECERLQDAQLLAAAMRDHARDLSRGDTLRRLRAEFPSAMFDNVRSTA